MVRLGSADLMARFSSRAIGPRNALLAWLVFKGRIGALQWLVLALVFGGVAVLAANS